MIQILHTSRASSVSEAVFFAFDNRAIPFRRHLALHLEPFLKKRDHIVLPTGRAGDHDERVHFYGTVRQIGDRLHMWYVGREGENSGFVNREGSNGRICYASSADGIHWEKPQLNLVELNGSAKNNLVRLRAGVDPRSVIDHADIVTCAVLHDPEDPDPGRQFKMAFLSSGAQSKCRMRVAFSPDGLDWTPSDKNPVGSWLEVCGLMKRNGLYYVNGQAAFTEEYGPAVRRLVTFCSSDFETWSSSPCVGLDRSPGLTGPAWDKQTGKWEEIHIGAGLWDRGNVVVGFYGMWHGHPSGDRREVWIDLGLAITHDGLHFHEPIPGFPIIPGAEEIDYTIGWPASLMQGQAFANIGDQTMHWYSGWRREGQVRLATWPRDRLGYLQLFRAGAPAECITAAFEAQHDGARLEINADGLGQQSALRVELLDEGFHPIPGYSGDDSAMLSRSGLRVPVQWSRTATLPRGPVRVRFSFAGLRPEDIKLFAIYAIQ